MAEKAMLRNEPWSALYERDLDLVLLELLHSSSAFREHLLGVVAPDLAIDPAAAFTGAWHSVIDDLGHESDLEAEWTLNGGGTFTLLVEDKLGAVCQPDQALRYNARAARYRANGRSVATRTVLVAPAAYPARHREDTAPFERHVAIEHIADWCESGGLGERGEYVARLLRHAIARSKSTATTSATSEALAPMYGVLYSVVAEIAPDLRITSTGSWVYFDFDARRKGAYLRLRLADHWAELVFSKAAVPEGRVATVLARAPLTGAEVASRGTTETAVWVPTPELDLAAPAEPQRDRALAAVATADALRRWYVIHADELHDVG